MADPRRLSFSAFSDYSGCGEKFRLRRIEKVPELPGMAMVGGSAFHEWTEQYDLDQRGFEAGIYEGVVTPPVVDFFTDAVLDKEEKSGYPRTEWQISGRKTKANPDKETFAVWYEQMLPDMADKYVAWRNTSKWKIATDLPEDSNGRTVGIEYDTSFMIDDVKIRFIIDRIMVDEHGNLGVVDIKTWSSKRSSIQLPTYAVGLREKGINALWGAYYNARQGTNSEPEYFMTWTKDRLRFMYAQADAMIQQGFFLPNPGDQCKYFCSVSSHCQFAVN